MKNKLTALIPVFLLAVIVIISCEKSEIESFDDSYNGIAFYIAGDNSETDSLSYSFAFNSEQLEKDTVFVKMRLVGEIKSFDREIGVEATEGTTAVEGTHFELPDIVLPAGEGLINYPLILFNTPDLAENEYKVVLKVVPTEDLGVGALGRELGTTTQIGDNISSSATTINIDEYTVSFSNKLSRPDYWDTLEAYDFGSFSVTKFQFMLQILGEDVIDAVNEWSYNQLINYRIKMQNALAEYEAENGLLIDENGEVVSFG